MKQKIAMVTEWAWSNKLIDSKEKLRAFAYVIFKKLSEKNPQARTNPNRAVNEIERDIYRCVLKLSYGGRKPAEISEARKAKLTEESHEFFLKSA
jgi:hypothetical protein